MNSNRQSTEHFHNNEHENMTEEEIKRHLEATRVKTIEKINFGEYEQDCWYYSPLPLHLQQKPVLYVCDKCLGFYTESDQLNEHKCMGIPAD